jgi:hypothetical protein
MRPDPRASGLSKFNSTFALAAGLVLASAGQAQPLWAEFQSFEPFPSVVLQNDIPVNSLNGVPIATSLDFGTGTTILTVFGDLVIPAGQRFRITGDYRVRVRVTGDLILESRSVIDARADGLVPGPGAGLGGFPPRTFSGPIGGAGGANDNDTGGAGDPGQNSTSSFGGAGGNAPRPGGRGGDGTFSSASPGINGLARGPAVAGNPGSPGVAGGNGSRAVGNNLPGGAGGAGGSTGGAPGAFVLASGGAGAGGAAGLGNQPGGNGTAGLNGTDGLPGSPGSPGSSGQNGAFFDPGTDYSTPIGGNGGGAGGTGASGGSGSGGSTGGSGGGGGAAQGSLFNFANGGGGGGAGGGGGRGGSGGASGPSGFGGGGGGAVEFWVLGKVVSAGLIDASGGDGQFGVLTPGQAGFFGGPGGAGGLGAFRGPLARGGNGGAGGAGGQGGRGGNGGTGGRGGGGAGGAVTFNAMYFLPLPGAGINVAGGVGGLGPAPNGRVFFADFVAGPSTLPVVSGVSRSDTGVIRYSNPVSPYFPNQSLPNIVSDASDPQGNLEIQGGPSPYGILPGTLADRGVTAVLGTIPPRARAAVIRYNGGPTSFDVRYAIASDAPVSQYDMYLIANLTPNAQSTVSINNVPLYTFPAATRFTAPAPQTPIGSLPANTAWAVCGPVNDNLDLTVRFGPWTRQLSIPDAVTTPQVVYIFEPCGLADLGGEGGLSSPDGELDNNDFIVFINLFFDSTPAADIGSEGGATGADGLFDNNDFIIFINQFFTGC